MSGYRWDRVKVIVVGGNAHTRGLASTILRAFGVLAIFEAASGEEAWSSLRETNPDMMLLDWEMAGMSGLDLTRMIRTNPLAPNPFVPVIMLTGHGCADHGRQARNAGVNEFIAKPLSARLLMAQMVSVIEHPRPYVRTGSYFGPCRRRGEIQGAAARRSADPGPAAQ